MAVETSEQFDRLTANAQSLELNCAGFGTVAFQLDGTWTATVTFEGTVNHGTWQTLTVTPTNSTTGVTTATGTGIWTGSCAGLLAVRARVSAFTSGTIDAQIRLAGTGGGSGSGGGGGGGSNVTIVDPIGQDTMANSVAVVIASDQSAVPVSGPLTDTQLRATAVPVSLATAPTTSVTQGTSPWVVGQSTATNLKAQAEAYQGGSAVGAANPLQVSLANTGANATAVKVDGSAATQPVSGTVTANQGTSPWIVAGGGTAGSAATGVVTVQGIPSMTKLLVTPDANSAVNVAQLAGIATSVNSGNKDAGTLRVVIATDQPELTNSQPVTLQAGSNLAGDVGIQPRAANGLTTMNATSSDGATALTSTAQAIKASAGLLYGWYIYNPNTATVFVQFYNTAAASVTVGTTNPLFMFTIPPLSAVNQMNALGITFSNAGFSWAATSTAGGSGAPTTALDAVAFYN